MNKLIVGLGNPGKEYEKTRHNAGFLAVDQLIEEFNFNDFSNDFKGILYSKKINSNKIFILKPQTFMNLSGQSVLEVVNFYKIKPENIIVIYDDKDFDLGKISFRSKGSSGGQKGMFNIINLLGTEEIKRIRIGIGKPLPNYKIVDWVLSKLKDDEINIIRENIKSCSNFLLDFCEDVPFEKIMSKYNREK